MQITRTAVNRWEIRTITGGEANFVAELLSLLGCIATVETDAIGISLALSPASIQQHEQEWNQHD